MARPTPQPLPTDERERVVAEFERALADAYPLIQLRHKARKLSRHKWYREMIDELYQFEMPDLPNAPQDKGIKHRELRAAVERVKLFVQSGRVYDDGVSPRMRMVERLIGVLFLAGLLGFIGLLILSDVLGEDSWAAGLFPVFAVVMGLILGGLVVLHLLGLCGAGVHIFRVRVLRQDLTPGELDDVWPYLSTDEYLADKRQAGGS